MMEKVYMIIAYSKSIGAKKCNLNFEIKLLNYNPVIFRFRRGVGQKKNPPINLIELRHNHIYISRCR